MTNLRLVKVEYYKVDETIMMEELVKVEHQINGKLRWDKLIGVCNDGRTRTISICTTEVCAFFVAQLRESIRKRDAVAAAAPPAALTAAMTTANSIPSSSHPSNLTIQTSSMVASVSNGNPNGYPSLPHASSSSS
jgi:hypothetical protein